MNPNRRRRLRIQRKARACAPIVLDTHFINAIGVFWSTEAADEIVLCFSGGRMSLVAARDVVRVVADFLEWRKRVRGERDLVPQFLGPSEDVMRELEDMTPAGAADRAAMQRTLREGDAPTT